MSVAGQMTPKVQERFWSKVDRSGGPNACWPWTAGGVPGSYGRFTCSSGNTTYAHRIACLLHNGPAPRPGLEVCHSRECTTRRCCNGSHLRWDTRRANIADAVALGKMRGEKCARATLTAAVAAEVWRRRQDGDGPSSIARTLGLTVDSVSAIVRGRTWNHVTGAPKWVAGAGKAARVAVAASMLLAGRGSAGVS